MLGMALSLSVLDRSKLTPCKFNPLCLCSSDGGEDLGAVECLNTELADIPHGLMDSRVFALTLSGNSLRILKNEKLRHLGCWRVEISNNELTHLPQAAFSGLERSVWQLILSGNQLNELPAASIERLNKLNYLDLSDNVISELEESQVKALAPTLKTLKLAGNSISSVPEGIFWNLSELQELDLSRNMIINIHSMALSTGLPLLTTLNLKDNLLSKIPFSALQDVKSLKTLDLSGNRIAIIADEFSKKNLKLDILSLEDNLITAIPTNSFRNFDVVNQTSLEGNQIHTVEENAFSNARIRQLRLQNCGIRNIASAAFRGLEQTLQEIDLANNRLTVLPFNVFQDFDSIKKMDLSNNLLAISPNYTFSDFRFSINELDLGGERMRQVPGREIGLLRNLRRLSLPSMHSYGNLHLDQFADFPPGLEDISLVNSNIKILRNNAFYHVPSISTLDLSGNRIIKIEDSAFKEIGNSLKNLRIRHALHMDNLASRPFQDLVSLERLDLSDNHLISLPLDLLHKMTHLRELYLQDNEIADFEHGTLHSQANTNLEILDLSFNHLRKIHYGMFRFEKLDTLLLNDNIISSLDKRSFVEMKSLKHLSLEGNDLSGLEDESFQHLHNLRTLSLAYNKLTSLNFESLDYVGSLGSLALDVSHNKINQLTSNKSNRYLSNSRVRMLDLSFNNISVIQPGYFDTVSTSLKVINLSNNQIDKLNKYTVGSLRKLYVLDLSYNMIDTLDEDCLSEMSKLQRLVLNNNRINTMHPAIFRSARNLEYFDVSNNFLNNINENLFQGTRLQTFKTTWNNLSEIPVKALNPVQSSLKHLDLAWNNISIISDSQLTQIRNLVKLDLSHNHIANIDERAFCCLADLVSLSLAHNPIKMFSNNLLEGVSSTLENLDLANTSLTLLPTLNLPHLISLNMSGNKLTFVPSSSLVNMTNIRSLDLSHNSMPSPPHNVWYILPAIATLSIAFNPILLLKNDSFMSLDRLQHLDIAGLDLLSLESGTFSSLPNLKSLAISVENNRVETLSSLLNSNPNLHSLKLFIKGASLKNHLSTPLPSKLRKISLVSPSITNLNPAAFKSVTSRRLELELVSDYISLERDLFLNLGATQNLTVDVAASLGDSEGCGKAEMVNGTLICERNKFTVSLPNPSSTYRLGALNSVFLENVNLGSKYFYCTCDTMGWLGKWLRRWRGQLCDRGSSSGVHHQDRCDSTVRGLRAARCSNYNDEGLLKTLRNLDCLSFNSSPHVISSLSVILVAMVAVFS